MHESHIVSRHLSTSPCEAGAPTILCSDKMAATMRYQRPGAASWFLDCLALGAEAMQIMFLAHGLVQESEGGFAPHLFQAALQGSILGKEAAGVDRPLCTEA